MSTLDRWHKEDMGVSRNFLPQPIARHRFCWHGYQGHTLDPHQHKWSRLNPCGYDKQSSGTHDTPWSLQMGSHPQHWTTWLDEADDARRIMIVKIFLKRVSVVIVHFIFSAVHESSGLIAILVFVLFWIVWKAKVARSTTRVIVVFSTHYIWCEQRNYYNIARVLALYKSIEPLWTKSLFTHARA